MKALFFSRSRAERAFILYTSTFLVIFGLFFLEFKFVGLQKSVTNFAAGIAFFDRFFVEYLSTLLLSCALHFGNRICRFLGHSLFSAILLVNVVQILALVRGNQFVSVLALANIGHISILFNWTIGLLIFLLTVFLLMLMIGIEYGDMKEENSQSRLIAASLVFLGLGICAHQSHRWLPESVIERRDQYFMANNTLHTSPTQSIVKLFEKQDFSKIILEVPDIEDARRHGISIDVRQPYPFVKKHIYEGELPFAKSAAFSSTDTKPNVIVFFTEGFSARTAGVYGSRYKDLTPNIDVFAANSMQVLNYYNHTAATYRGVLGQYCSIFPYYAASETWDERKDSSPEAAKYCINRMLNKINYKTLFFDSHVRDAAFVDEMMTSLGVDEVFTAENLFGRYIPENEAFYEDALSDNQFMRGFVSWLKAHESGVAQSKPFMVGLYNLGTHAWRDVARDGKVYADGKNTALNTVHNWDHSFGEFWTYFKASKYAKNTIVILTSDHSHYSEEPYLVAMEGVPDYQGYFVDQIPLIIYDPRHTLPSTYDAHYATSLDFAPSLAHLLEMPNTKNAFLGSSIFSVKPKPNRGVGLVSIGTDTYLVDKDKIHHRIGVTNMIPQIDVAERIIGFSKQMEITNRLWNPEWNDDDTSFLSPVSESTIIQDESSFE